MSRCLLIAMAAVGLWAAPAIAEPPQALVDGLRQENQTARTVIRDAVSFCKDTLFPSTPRTLVYQCADRMQAALSMVSAPTVATDLKAVERARTVAGVAGLTNVEAGRAEAARALPVFIDFLAAMDAAERPAKQKRAGK